MASLFNWFNRSLCKCHFTSNRKGVPTFSSCPRHPASDVSLPTYQPEDSGLVPLGFLMLDLSGDGASSSTRTQSSESLPSTYPSTVAVSRLGWKMIFSSGLFFSSLSLFPGTVQALVRFWMLLLDNLWAMEIQGADGAPVMHGHAPLSLLLSDCCSSLPHQLAVTLRIFSVLGSPNFKCFLKIATHSKFYLKDSYIFQECLWLQETENLTYRNLINKALFFLQASVVRWLHEVCVPGQHCPTEM